MELHSGWSEHSCVVSEPAVFSYTSLDSYKMGVTVAFPSKREKMHGENAPVHGPPRMAHQTLTPEGRELLRPWSLTRGRMLLVESMNQWLLYAGHRLGADLHREDLEDTGACDLLGKVRLYI